MKQIIPRANVLGVGVSAINMQEALNLFEHWIENDQRGYVCVTGVHGVMEAQRDAQFRKTLNESLLTTPDGMPTVWVGRLQGYSQMDRVFGPDLMLNICEMSCDKGYTHFFYGGPPGLAQKLQVSMQARFPELRVVGTYTPPFGPLMPHQELELIELVASLKPDII